MKKIFKTYLTEHFMLYEFVRSGMAIERDIDNTPGESQVRALRSLCENVLEPLRRRFGPIVISSGYRCRQVNRLVGGATNSQHCLGEAADIVTGSKERALRLYDFIVRHTDFDQVILEPVGSDNPRWIHVSYTTKRKNRHDQPMQPHP